MSDLDALKALNDRYGYDVGNAFLRAKAATLQEAGLEAYHDKGDEFLCRGHNIKELQANLECARSILRGRTVVVERTNGDTLRFTGADFSYGVGKDLDEAEFGLKSHKADRKARGELERGKLCGIRKGENPEGDAPCMQKLRTYHSPLRQADNRPPQQAQELARSFAANELKVQSIASRAACTGKTT
jgi:hypothetical protein